MTYSLFGFVDSQINAQVSLRWRMSYNKALFEELCALGQLQAEPDEESGPENEGELLEIGPVLSDLSNPTHLLAISCVKEDENLYWLVRERRAPEEAPPSSILAASERAGAYQDVCKKLLALVSEHQLVGTYSITAYLPEADGWRCKLFSPSQNIPDELKELGSAVHNEEVGYRFEGGTSGLEEASVIYDHGDSEFVLTIKARSLLEVEGKELFPFTMPNKLIQLVMNRAFVKA